MNANISEKDVMISAKLHLVAWMSPLIDETYRVVEKHSDVINWVRR